MRDIAQGRYSEAVSRIDELLREPDLKSEECALLWNKRGVAFMHMHEREQARASFERALSIAPRYAPVLVNVGNMHLEAGAIEAAIQQYELAVQSDANYAPAHHHLGIAYKRLGRTADAVRALRRAHRLEGRAAAKNPGRFK